MNAPDNSTAFALISARSRAPGGLAARQATHVRAYIADNLTSRIRATDLAAIVRLSTSHFSRAFRETFGRTPRAYIMQQRVLLAQELMLNSRRPIAEIALDCGMCDQPHLTRVFRRIVGLNPRAWRRQFAPASIEPHRAHAATHVSQLAAVSPQRVQPRGRAFSGQEYPRARRERGF